MSQLLIGEQAPDFELSDIHGRTYRLSDALSHGPVALLFYKSACPTCQFSFPHIQRMFSAVGKTAGLTVWGISEDDVDETKQFAAQHGLTFNLLIDEYPYAVSAAYGLQFVPAIFRVQPDGKISVSEYGFTKAGLNQLAGVEYFKSNDGLPATRPG
jgi:peroxiredoxin